MEDYCLEEELDLLSSYFCLNGESCNVISKNLISITMKLLVQDTQDSTLSLSFELPPEYPLVNPNVSIQCSHQCFTRNLASSISDLLNDEARTLIGEPMMLQLCQSAKSHVIEFLTSTMEAKPSIVSNSDVKIANDECQISQPLCCLTCLQIDHMRNRTGYLKILSKWANQLKLKILVIQKLFTKRQQYLIFIWGSNEDTKSFLKNLKTHSVDVDSNGKPCKERLVNVVCTVNSENDFYKISISEGALKFEEIDND